MDYFIKMFKGKNPFNQRSRSLSLRVFGLTRADYVVFIVKQVEPRFLCFLDQGQFLWQQFTLQYVTSCNSNLFDTDLNFNQVNQNYSFSSNLDYHWLRFCSLYVLLKNESGWIISFYLQKVMDSCSLKVLSFGSKGPQVRASVT